ncbi:MAG: hypothetical protein HUJ91_07280 [Bacteroidales bacterium]|nr:hypothetical protein [Bacteroidales bacterium]
MGKKLPQGGSVPFITVSCVSLVTIVAAVLYYNASRRNVVRKATADSLRRSAGPSAVLRYARANVYGVSAVLVIAAVVGLTVGGAYYLFVVPMALSAVALILHKLTGWRGWFLFAWVTLLLYIFEYSMVALPVNGSINLVTEAPRLYALTILTCSLIDLYLAGE